MNQVSEAMSDNPTCLWNVAWCCHDMVDAGVDGCIHLPPGRCRTHVTPCTSVEGDAVFLFLLRHYLTSFLG